jgi:hypothetical protein
MLSQTLAAMQATQSTESTVAQSDMVIKAAHSAKYSLTAVIATMQGNTALPNLVSWMQSTISSSQSTKSKVS